MALFKPVMVNNKTDLDTVAIVDGQYIVVINANELYLDRNKVREKVSQNVYIQADAPATPKNGDIWFQIEAEGGIITYIDPFSGEKTIFTVPKNNMTWNEFINSEYNTNGFFYLSESSGMNVWASKYNLLISITFPDGTSLDRSVLDTDIIVPGSFIS